MSRPAARLPELDLLRLVAASGVVFYHFCFTPVVAGVANTTVFGGLHDFARYGYLGVNLFFVISGFVILMTAQRRTARGFLVHRALRLYPSYWVAMALTTSVVLLLGREPYDLGFRTIAANLTMLAGYLGAPFVDGVYWTLAVELKFYAIVFVLMLLGQLSRAEWWAYAWLSGVAVTELGYGGGVLRSLTMAPHGAFFAGGTLLYMVYARGWTPLRGLGVAAAATLGQISAVESIPGFITGPRPPDDLIVRVLAVACFAAVAAAATWPSTLRRPQRWAAAAALTYPLYLVHARIGHLLFERWEGTLSPAGAVVAVVVLVYAVAWVMGRGIEQRLVPWLSHRPIIGVLEGPLPAPAAEA